MAENTKIEWADHTASPWHGCEKVSAGCDNCYAEKLSGRNPGVLGVWGDDGVRVKSKSFASNLRAWDKQAKKEGKTVTVFPSLCDPFEDRPELIPWREEMFQLADECQNVILLLLTKRPENILRMWPMTPGIPQTVDDPTKCRVTELMLRPNVWLGTSVENQEQAEKRIPELLKCRDLSPVLFLSCEPLLGRVDLSHWMVDSKSDFEIGQCNHFRPSASDPSFCKCKRGAAYHPRSLTTNDLLDWIIVGGESGPGSRPMHPDWVRSIRDQCVAAEVPFLFKQWGEWQNGSAMANNATVLNNGSLVFPDTVEGRESLNRQLGHRWNEFNPVAMAKVGKKVAGRLLDGVEWNQFPEVV